MHEHIPHFLGKQCQPAKWCDVNAVRRSETRAGQKSNP